MENTKSRLRPRVLVSVIVYHRDQFLDQCIKSVLAQLLPQDKFLIIDNKSIKSVRTITRGYKSYTQVVIKKSHSSNIATARNLAMDYCKVNNINYCIFLDDDCVASKNWVDNLVRSHQDYPKAVAIMGRVEYLPRSNVYSMIEQELWNHWVAVNYHNRKLMIIDTKNSLFYIPEMIFSQFVSGKDNRREDIVMSYNLNQNKKTILISRNAVVSHYERTSFLSYLTKRLDLIISDKKISYKFVNANIKSNSLRSEFGIVLKIAIYFLKRKSYLNVVRLIMLCFTILVCKILVKFK